MRGTDRTWSTRLRLLAIVIPIVWLGAVHGQSAEEGVAAAESQSTNAPRGFETPTFHHLHLNSLNPSRAVAEYHDAHPTATLVTVFGFEGIRAVNGVTLLFQDVDQPLPAPGPDRVSPNAPQTAFWHHVWASNDARVLLDRLRAEDPAFDRTRMIPQYTGPEGDTVDFSSDTISGFLTTSELQAARRRGADPTHRGGYFNWYGPDGVVMETSDGGPENYRLIGMFQEQPFCAVHWYRRHLNAALQPSTTDLSRPAPEVGRPEADCRITRSSDVSWPSTYKRGHNRNPLAQSVYFDDVRLRWYMNQERVPLVSTRGQLVDHIAIGVTDLDRWLAKLTAEGVTILEGPYALGDTRAFLIEGPSREALELVDVVTGSDVVDRTVQLPSRNVFYRDSGGDGAVTLFLHAGSGNNMLCEKQIPAFTAAGYRFIAVDYRGVASEDRPADRGVSSRFINELLAELGVERFHLLGTAAGGGVALEYALDNPNKLRSLVVAHSIGNVQDQVYRDLGHRLRPAAFRQLPLDLRELGPSYRAAHPEGVQRWRLSREPPLRRFVGPPPGGGVTWERLKDLTVLRC